MSDDDGKIEVTLDVVARGQVKVRMTRAEYERIFPEGDMVDMPLEDVPGLDMDDALNALDFRCEDVWVDADLKGVTSGAEED